ncbi:amidase [Colletotrichum graminicola]|uniref:amidase n=1 Tax=Colletotrichum graminicola (strain M1.001 / M2 / FGSC 10212) TaxID=645133 RepID=E3QY06_COLGM|nr:amidase [Colletotrichum graminicola M1.001]EFQ35744.1 amidase [Colletotrichum graminicola M1.001]WDK10311.1 amidase [Colletotrichum graminicola]
MSRPWTEVVAEKRAIRDEKLSKSYGEDAPSDPRIFAAKDAQDLVKLLEAREITSEAVVIAHIAKAKDAHRRTNCLTEICFDEALEQARELDAFQQEHGRLKGPLHGVPVSLKDQFNLEGLDSTLGYVGRAFHPADSDCILVTVLKQLGAIILAKTNLPQSILWGETENPLWGLTTHPMNPEFTPGGSSGGEGTLLALNGSALGWGTDIGGSIRVPSHMNGLWGLKPSSGRFSYEGVANSQDGQIQIPSAVGPMARTLNTLTLASKAVIEAEAWRLDPQIPPLPWRDDVFRQYSQKPLVIGVMVDNGIVKVHPPIERVFTEFCQKLEAAGHELVPWDTSLNVDCIKLMDEHYVVDGGEDIRRDVAAGGEPFMPHTQSLVERGSAISVYEYWQLNKRKKATQAAYNKMWNAARASSGRPVDVLLVPTMPHTAIPHRTLRHPGYTKIFNFLDYTALSFPAGKASKALDPPSPVKYEPRNAADAWNWSLYNIEKMDGYSVGLQIVGRRMDEEKVLGVAQQVQNLLQVEA